jgi:hypothetical protein
MTGAPVHLRLATGTTVRGVVELVAEDFVAIEPDGDRRQRLYLPLEAVDEALFISG